MEEMLLCLRSFHNQEPKASEVWQMTILIKLIKHLAGLLTGVMPLRGLDKQFWKSTKPARLLINDCFHTRPPHNSDSSRHRTENTLGASPAGFALFLNSAQCSVVGRGLLCPLCPLVPLSSTLCVSFVGNVCLLSFREALLFHLLGLSSMENC